MLHCFHSEEEYLRKLDSFQELRTSEEFDQIYLVNQYHRNFRSQAKYNSFNDSSLVNNGKKCLVRVKKFLID